MKEQDTKNNVQDKLPICDVMPSFLTHPYAQVVKSVRILTNNIKKVRRLKVIAS